MLEPDELKRRIDAIRTLRGLRQVDLAALMEADGHGKHDVGRLERGDVHLTPSLRRSLAHHLRVSDTWFTEPDMDRILAPAPAEGPAETGRLDRIESVLAHHTELLMQSQELMRSLAAGLKLEAPSQEDLRRAALDRLREDLAARDREASGASPQTRTTSTG